MVLVVVFAAGREGATGRVDEARGWSAAGTNSRLVTLSGIVLLS
jgi:hypothetical protein